MISRKHLDEITDYIKNNVALNDDIMLSSDENYYQLTEMIFSLHNLLHEAVTGERYDYMFHWCNKTGAWTESNFFDSFNPDDPDKKIFNI